MGHKLKAVPGFVETTSATDPLQAEIKPMETALQSMPGVFVDEGQASTRALDAGWGSP